jgi:sulfide:quinone oxidoreductase
MTAPRIVILGAGTGGTLAANRLRREIPDAHICVVDRDNRHVYQPGLLFVPFGLAEPGNLVRRRSAQLHAGIEFRIADVERADLDANVVHLGDGSVVPYDALVIATGAELQPAETEGLDEAGERVHTFYTLDGAARLRDPLARLDRGRLVVNFVDLPIKCPVAPLEFCFLADWFLRERGVRDDVELVLATPLDAAFTKPVAAEHLAGLLDAKGIRVESEFATGAVAADRLVSWDEREVPFDLLVTVPLHGGAAFVARSPGLGDELGFVRTDPHTLQAAAAPNVFALGDAADVPTSKAGSVTHFEGETLVANVRHLLAAEPLESTFDGHANCFIETGFGKALLIDFDYEREPLPGHYGVLPLLKESRLNHLAKTRFDRVYWNVLLKGGPRWPSSRTGRRSSHKRSRAPMASRR